MCPFVLNSNEYTQITGYLILFRPYASPVDQFTSTLSEGGMAFILIILSLFNCNLNGETKDFYSTAVIATVLTIVGAMSIVSFFRLTQSIRTIVREYVNMTNKAKQTRITFRNTIQGTLQKPPTALSMNSISLTARSGLRKK